MRKLLLASTIALLPIAAQAELFNLGTSYNVQANGVTGGNVNTSTPLQAGSVALTTVLDLTTSIIATPGGGEWLVFDFHTADGQPLSAGGNFDLHEIGLPAAVPVNFDAAFAAADINGVQQTWTGSPFGGYTPSTNPLLGTGLNAGPFTADFPAGPLGDFFTFIDPFSQLLGCCGLNTPNLTSYEQAWHFDPQQVVETPEPGTAAILGFALLGTIYYARRRRE